MTCINTTVHKCTQNSKSVCLSLTELANPQAPWFTHVVQWWWHETFPDMRLCMWSEGPWPGERSPAQTGVWDGVPDVICMNRMTFRNPYWPRMRFLLYNSEDVHMRECAHRMKLSCPFLTDVKVGLIPRCSGAAEKVMNFSCPFSDRCENGLIPRCVRATEKVIVNSVLSMEVWLAHECSFPVTAAHFWSLVTCIPCLQPWCVQPFCVFLGEWGEWWQVNFFSNPDIMFSVVEFLKHLFPTFPQPWRG